VFFGFFSQKKGLRSKIGDNFRLHISVEGAINMYWIVMYDVGYHHLKKILQDLEGNERS